MLDMRLKLPELMKARGMETAYALAKASKGALSLSTANRLVEVDGRPKRIDMSTLDTLCDMFGIDDVGDILERDKKRR